MMNVFGRAFCIGVIAGLITRGLCHTLIPQTTPFVWLGPNAVCDHESVPGRITLCFDPDMPLPLAGSNTELIVVDGTMTVRERVTNITRWAINRAGAVVIGHGISFGEPGTITVAMTPVEPTDDGIWIVDKMLYLDTGARIQQVRLPGSSLRGTRLTPSSGPSVVVLSNGVMVYDNDVSLATVYAGLASRSSVISQYPPYVGGSPAVLVSRAAHNVRVDGVQLVLLYMYTSPSTCGNTLSRQKQYVYLDTSVCAGRSTYSDAVLYTSDTLMFYRVQCPPTVGAGNLTIMLYNEPTCSTSASIRTQALGVCLSNDQYFIQCEMGA